MRYNMNLKYTPFDFLILDWELVPCSIYSDCGETCILSVT